MDGSQSTGTLRRLPLFALLGANAVSQVGNVLTFVAVPWFVLQTTGSAAKTGLVGGAAALAFVASALLGGPIVDRLGFRRTSVAADLASGVTVGLIPLLYAMEALAFWQLLVLVFLGALLDTPGMTARQSLIPDLARRAGVGIERANSAEQAMVRMSQLLGPPLGGVLIVALGASNVLWVDAATFAASALLVIVAVPYTVRTGEETRNDVGYLKELAEGLLFIRRERLIFSLVIVAVVFGFLDNPLFAVVLPVYVDAAYGSATSYGLIFGSFGGGALIGALVYGAVGYRLPRRALFLTALPVYALPISALAAFPSLPVAASAFFVAGLGTGPLNPLIFTIVQERTPERMLGRVFGALYALALMASPLGMVTAGYVLEFASVRFVLVSITACYLAVSLLSLLNPALRQMGAPAKPAGE